ncbi:MAG TPA: FkbM family methyltransferase [Pyrinomonadaceae bacterium]|nr:FkbM family methyltransferase [Pyrinomonadaceae bacterium]
MIPNVLKAGVKRALGVVGLEVRRKGSGGTPAPAAAGSPRCSLTGVLRQARGQGFVPATVIDVGAAFGWFATECHGVFPEAEYVLVEPLEEYGPHLDAFVGAHPSQARLVRAAAAARPGELTIHVHPDLMGSSLYLEEEVANVNGVPRTVQTVALDDVVDERGLRPPFLLKVDVQGAELDVLSGFERHLRETEFVLLEVSFFKFFEGGPQLHDVVEFMRSKGFVAYDVYDLQYRPLDNALSQVDMAFVKESGRFRQHHYYASRRQREEQFKTAPTA